LDYAVDVQAVTHVCIVCNDGSETDFMSVADVAEVIGGREFRKVTWRQGEPVERWLRGSPRCVFVPRRKAGPRARKNGWLSSVLISPNHQRITYYPRYLDRSRAKSLCDS
jgi:hypothetical protein